MSSSEIGPPTGRSEKDSGKRPADSGSFLKFGQAAAGHENTTRPFKLPSELKHNILVLFKTGTISLEIARKIETGNFVNNFSTKGRPIPRDTNHQRNVSEMYDVRPPSPADMVLEIFRSAEVFQDEENGQAYKMLAKNYLDYIYLEFAGTPEKTPGATERPRGIPSAQRLQYLQSFARTPALVYFDSMRLAVQDLMGSTYDANLDMGEQFLAFVAAKLQMEPEESTGALPNIG